MYLPFHCQQGIRPILNQPYQYNQCCFIAKRTIIFWAETSAQTDQAKQSYIAQNQTEQLTAQNIVAQTRTAYQNIFYDLKIIQSGRQTVIEAKKAYQSDLITYKSGLLDITALLSAKQTVYTQQKNLLNTQYDYALEIIKLRQAIGVLGKPDIVNLSFWLK